jgi:hypothetical protein
MVAAVIMMHAPELVSCATDTPARGGGANQRVLDMFELRATLFGAAADNAAWWIMLRAAGPRGDQKLLQPPLQCWTRHKPGSANRHNNREGQSCQDFAAR